jgi:hypothetical protein
VADIVVAPERLTRRSLFAVRRWRNQRSPYGSCTGGRRDQAFVQPVAGQTRSRDHGGGLALRPRNERRVGDRVWGSASELSCRAPGAGRDRRGSQLPPASSWTVPIWG